MRPLKTIIAGTLALLAAAPLSAQTKAEENKKPNILFIITEISNITPMYGTENFNPYLITEDDWDVVSFLIIPWV